MSLVGRDRIPARVGDVAGGIELALPVRFKANSRIWFAKSGNLVLVGNEFPAAISRCKWLTMKICKLNLATKCSPVPPERLCRRRLRM